MKMNVTRKWFESKAHMEDGQEIGAGMIRPNTLGAQIAALRQIRGLTQQDLAQRTGLQPAAISHFETGHREPTIKNLIKLCNGLSCTPNDILQPKEAQG